MRQRSFLRRSLVSVMAFAVAVLACGACGEDAPRDEPRFGLDATSCADAVPPCSTTPEGGADLDAPVQPVSDGGPCDYANTCPSATDIGGACCDEGTDTKTFEGTSSAWVAFRALECGGGVRAAPMKILAELTVPTGSNFDLYMYTDETVDTVSCSSLSRKSTGASDATETVALQWGESFVANTLDDSRPIRFEIRHVSGACTAGAKWKLTISGNREATLDRDM